MKKIVIPILLVCLLVAISFIYKNSKIPFLYGFPSNKMTGKIHPDGTLYLFIFFSKGTCSPCLDFIRVLNRIQDQFPVIGIIPDREYSEKELVARITGAQFPIESVRKYRKYAPTYNPTLYGVTKKGRILFALPGVEGEGEYLESFLLEIKRKAYILLTER
jgi:thioredoxin-related protein